MNAVVEVSTREAIAHAAARGPVIVTSHDRPASARLVFWSSDGKKCRVQYSTGRAATVNKTDVLIVREVQP